MKKNLKQARSDAGITQAEIAKKTNVTYQMVSQWEKGIAPVARKHWKTLSFLLHVDESELEEILVQTMLDRCIEQGDIQELIRARISRTYSATVVYDAILRFEENKRTGEQGQEKSTDELERLYFERKLLERDKRIFELEKQVEELRRELERRRPAIPSSSVLNIEPLKSEVNHE